MAFNAVVLSDFRYGLMFYFRASLCVLRAGMAEWIMRRP